MVSQMWILGSFEVVEPIKMLAYANHPPRVYILHNKKLIEENHNILQSSCQLAQELRLQTI